MGEGSAPVLEDSEGAWHRIRPEKTAPEGGLECAACVFSFIHFGISSERMHTDGNIHL